MIGIGGDTVEKPGLLHRQNGFSRISHVHANTLHKNRAGHAFQPCIACANVLFRALCLCALALACLHRLCRQPKQRLRDAKEEPSNLALCCDVFLFSPQNVTAFFQTHPKPNKQDPDPDPCFGLGRETRPPGPPVPGPDARRGG